MLAEVSRALLGGAAVGGTAYLLAAVAALEAFRRKRPPRAAGPLPPLTVLKPVCGAESGLRENLASFCEQDYPAYQVVFGVRDAADPAIPVIRQVMRDFSRVETVLVLGARAVGANPKITNVANMLARARHDTLVIADSDMRVGQDYLRAVAAPFADPGVGAVTCLYGGRPGPGLPSALGSLFIEDWFLPSVLVAVALQPPRYCFGATMAVRRAALEAIGGIEVLAPYLADDHELGRRVSAQGFDVRLSRYVLEGQVAEADFGGLLAHELRWARTIRACSPAGYAFSFLERGPITLAVLYAILTGLSAPGLALLVAATALRVILHVRIRRVVRTPGGPLWLIPLRDLLCLAVWAVGLVSRHVAWRADTFSVSRDGRLAVLIGKERP